MVIQLPTKALQTTFKISCGLKSLLQIQITELLLKKLNSSTRPGSDVTTVKNISGKNIRYCKSGSQTKNSCERHFLIWLKCEHWKTDWTKHRNISKSDVAVDLEILHYMNDNAQTWII